MPANPFRRIGAVLLSGAAACSLAACASVPGAGLAAGAPITAEEAQLGAQYHEQFVAEFGGAMTGPQAQYVQQIGQDVAVASGMANAQGAFNFTLLNSPVNNAFAVPGGYVYITRQMVALMNNEAELAGVLGHEIGHVSARHSARRQSSAQRNQIIGLLGQVLAGAVLGDTALGRGLGELATTAPQLATLSYSRNQEIEADELGIQYLRATQYDPRGVATMLSSLAAQNALEASIQGSDATIPEWASTHPNPASRVQNALAAAAGTTGVINREAFLNRIDGMRYGDDPAQGIIEGNTFIHPDLRLAFSVPQGFYMINGVRAVSINSDNGRAQLTTAPYSGNLESYIQQVFRALGGQQQQLAPQAIQRTTVNGLQAAYGTARVANGQQNVDVVVFAYEFSNNQAYHFAAITPAGQAAVFNPMFNSMRRISTAEAAQVVGRVVDVVTATRADSVRTLANRMAFDTAQEARFRILNGLGADEQVVPGQQYKIVVRAN